MMVIQGGAWYTDGHEVGCTPEFIGPGFMATLRDMNGLRQDLALLSCN